MARRTELKGIANALNESFMSRNNDYHGYWSIGMMKRFALENGVATLRCALIPPQSASTHALLVEVIARRYACRLAELLRKQQIPERWVKEASIHLDFSAQDNMTKRGESGASGQPYACVCQITDDNGRLYTSLNMGRCLPHSAAREWRSTR